MMDRGHSSPGFCALVLSVGFLSSVGFLAMTASMAQAAGAGKVGLAVAPARGFQAPLAGLPGSVDRRFANRQWAGQSLARHGDVRRHGRRFVGWPATYPGPLGLDLVMQDEREGWWEPLPDSDAFPQRRASTGIPYPPTPKPVIYRIEGTRERPVMRVISLGNDSNDSLPSRRPVRVENGATILSVPR